MISYVYFHIELILGIWSIVNGVRAVFRNDYERVGTMLVILLYSIIGLRCEYWDFVREFSAIYGIVWDGVAVLPE